MSMLFADSSGSGSARGAEPRWRQVARHPLVVLALGLLAMAVFLLVLFGPFYLFDFPPGQLLVWGILDGPGALLPNGFQWWLGDHAFIALLVLSGLLLVVVPWYIADVRQRAERRRRSAGSTSASTSRSASSSRSGFSISAGITRERRETSVEFTEDGRVERSGGTADGAAQYSVADLRSMARASGIPWNTAYETEGGARAFLELIRAVHAGTASTPTSTSTSTSTSTPTSTPTPTSASTPGSAIGDSATPLRDPSEGSATWRETAPTGAGHAPASAGAGGFTTSSASASSTSAPFSSSTTSTTSWTSGLTSSGSVYTPTSLYDAERAERTVLGTGPQDDIEETEGRVEDR